jgi:Flp pilus assembly protein TadG
MSVKMFLKRERGIVVVESAMVLMTFFIITLGMIELGIGVWIYNSVAHAAREGARYAIVHGTGYCPGCTPDEIASSIKTATINSAIGLKLTTADITVTPIPNYAVGSQVSVLVSYTYRPIGHVLPRASVALHSTSRMVISF